jgi:hypothetical protein
MAGGHGGARPNTGGRRTGAGRPAGSSWKPMVAAMRVAAVEHVQKVVDADTDPLVIALSIAADSKNPLELRLGACAMTIPVMYPRLSATQVTASHTVTRVDPHELMDRISERIARQAPAAIEGKAVEQIEGEAEPPNQVAA